MCTVGHTQKGRHKNMNFELSKGILSTRKIVEGNEFSLCGHNFFLAYYKCMSYEKFIKKYITFSHTTNKNSSLVIFLAKPLMSF